MKNRIKNIVEVYLLENIGLENINIHTKYIDDLKNEITRFETEEDLLRSGGGLSIELLDRLAFGFSEKDITTLNPKDLMVRWEEDYNNVLYEIKYSELSMKEWALNVDLSEPIDVSYMEYDNMVGFYVEDGHHRYVAAKILNKPLNVNLEIKISPTKVIAPQMGYDTLIRYLFNHYKKF